MHTLTCKTCKHFHQHYILSKDYGATVNCGHCTCRNNKHRRADAKTCDLYEPPETPHTPPSRRETIRYLTTEVLEYILSLDLPPEIDN